MPNCKGLATPVLKYRGNPKLRALGFLFLSNLKDVDMRILLRNNCTTVISATETTSDMEYLTINNHWGTDIRVDHMWSESKRKYERLKDYTGRIKL